VISDETTVIEEEDIETEIYSVSEDGNTFIISNDYAEVQNINEGSILVGGISDMTPFGFSKNVLSTTVNGDSVTVETENASLNEVIEQGRILLNHQFTIDDIDSLRTAKGVKFNRKEDRSLFSYDIDQILYDEDNNHNTTDDQIKAEGNFEFDVRFILDAIYDFGLEYFEAAIEIENTENLNIIMNVEIDNFEEEILIAEIYFYPITIYVGILPVVIFPSMPIYLNIDGSISTNAVMGITRSETFRTGAKYSDGNWININEHEENIDYITPEIDGNIEIRAGISPNLVTKIYDLAGPYIGIEIYGELIGNAQVEQDEYLITVDLYAGIDAILGFIIEVIDDTIVDYPFNFELFRDLIYHHEIITENNPPNPPSNPIPSDNASSVSLNTNLCWTCSDPENDPLTYDVYFGLSSNPSILNSGQSEIAYELETLIGETTYYWKIIAYDNHNNSTTSSIWQFTTESDNNEDFEWCYILEGEYTWGEDDEVQNIGYCYEIMKYEVTNQQYVNYLIEALDSGDITVTNTTVLGYLEGDENYSAGTYEFLGLDHGYCRIDWNGSIFSIISGYENHPVVAVSWFGAWAFAEHYGLRLPTEQEWEKAARGMTGYEYPFGDILTGDRANYSNSGDPYEEGNWICSPQTTPVGFYNGQSFQGFQTIDSPSTYGVYDMCGNVCEWTNSWWSYSNSCVVRGGSWGWDSANDFLCSWYHNISGSPYNTDSETGFRCARTQ